MLKKPLSALLSLFILLSLLLSLASCEFPASDNGSTESTGATTATGKNPSDPTAVALDFYVINDLHGHVGDGGGVGIGQVATYLKKQENQNRILLSTGDMWQGTPESNNTKGKLVTEWMNELGFDAMIPGNHEFDWGQEAINENVDLANFPFLAINIYDKATDKPSVFCTPSVMLARENVKIGIIGAIGDVYSSISAGKVKDCYFKVGDDLTALVKEESRKLRLAGADVVVYAIHDGYSGRTNNPSVPVKDDYLEHYDTSLSDGYVDLVFEGHTHTQNIYTDKYGVYHLQGGSNNNAIAHVKMTVNQENQTNRISKAELVKTSSLGSLQKDPNTMSLFQKYADMIGNPHAVIGQNSVDREGDELRQLCADLYLEVGMEKWGNTYDISWAAATFPAVHPGICRQAKSVMPIYKPFSPLITILCFAVFKART